MSRNVKRKRKKKTLSQRQAKAKSIVIAARVKAFCLIMLYLLVVVSIGVIAYSYYYFNNNPPTTVAIGEVDSLVYSSELQYPIEISYYTNDKQNGKRVYETRINYYLDTLLPETSEESDLSLKELEDKYFKQTYSQGMQFVDDIEFTMNFEKMASIFDPIAILSYTPKDAYFYNTSNGTSYDAIQRLDYLDKWIIDFGEQQLGRITQDAPDKFISGNFMYSFYQKQNINALLKDIYQCIDSLEYGKQVILFDLSDYLTFEYFAEDLKFHKPETDEQHLYINILVDKSVNGMIDHSQSLFGMVENNANWNITGVDATDYWTSHAEINLTSADFDVVDGKLKLKTNAINYYSVFDPTLVDLIINIDLSTTDGTGFSQNAFGKLLVDKIIITSTFDTTFSYYELPENCQIIASDNVALEVIV